MPPIPTLLPSEEIDRDPCRSKNCMKILKTLVLLKLWKKKWTETLHTCFHKILQTKLL